MKIVEVDSYFGKKYIRYNDEGELINTVSIVSYIHETDNKRYYVFFSSDGKMYDEAYRYLNYEIGNCSLNKRIKSATALKFLYSFMELFSIQSLNDVEINDIKKLIAFLKGGDNEMFKAEAKSHSTVNGYLGAIRSYFKYLGIENEALNEEVSIGRDKSSNSFLSHGIKKDKKKYRESLKENKVEESPLYISFTEYEKIMSLIDSEYDIREKIIVKLMYEYGLRIGEVLGLTLEDIVSDETTDDGGALIIRNRLTDKPYQFAKGCEKVTDRSAYNSIEYRKKNIGYQKIEISQATLDLINQYIDETKDGPFISEILMHNYSTKNIADKVTNSKEIEENKYIFLGKNFTPLSNTGWNKIIKKIYVTVGIKVDIGVKEDNLNHRFRHGFAMYKIMVEKYDLIRVSKALRHRSIYSALRYFNPSKEDRLKMVEDTEKLLKLGGINID